MLLINMNSFGLPGNKRFTYHFKLIIVKAARIPLLIKKFKLRSYSHILQLVQMAEWKGVGLGRRM